jgi:hypothetical protein
MKSLFSNLRRLATAVRRNGLCLGVDLTTKHPVHLSSEWLGSHVDVSGPTGVGKSRLLLSLFRQLCEIPDATVIVFSPKGDLVPMAHDAAIAAGFSKRVVLFDPGDPEYVLGYNPLRPNGLPIATHARAVRESIRSAWGSGSFDATPQLARLLNLALFAARERELTLVEAMTLLRPQSDVRARVLAEIEDSLVREALLYFDSLSPHRQEELAASTLARLEPFVLDPTIRRMIARSDESLDLAALIRNRRILLVNLERNRPLRTDDVKLLGRLLLGDILSHVFARPAGQRSRVYLIVDELETFATPDLAIALDQGRELGVSLIVAHQDEEQLLLEDRNERLLHAVRQNTRTKIVFGGGWTPSLNPYIEHFFLDRVDPLAIKDELRTLEIEPVECMRRVRSRTTSRTTHVGVALTETTTSSETEGRNEQEGESDTVAHGHSSGSGTIRTHTSGETVGEGLTILPDGQVIPTTSEGNVSGSGESANHSETDTYSESSTVSRSRGRTWAVGRGRTTGIVPSRGVSHGRSETVTWQPSTRYEKRRIVSSRTFWTEQEVLTKYKQIVEQLPRQHFVVKVSTKPAVFVRAPDVEPVALSSTTRARARAAIFAAPFYATRAAIEHHESAVRNAAKDNHQEPRLPTPRRARKRYGF